MKKKKELNLYPFYDLTGMARHLEAASEKGWFLKKTGTFLWEYEKKEPRKLKYSLCWSGESEAYEPSENGPRTFREQAKQAGWSPAALSDRLQVYCSEDPEARRLSVSPFDRIMGVDQAAKPHMMIYGTLVFLGILSILLFFFKMKIMPVAALAGSFSLVIPVVLSLLAVYFAADMILYGVLKNRADILATKGEYAENTVPMDRILFWLLIFAGAMLALGAVIGGRSPMLGTFLVFLVAILGLLLVIKAVRSTVQGQNRGLTIAVDIVLAVILVAGVTLAVTKINQADAGWNGELPVTAQELGMELDEEELQDYSTTQSSALLRYTEASQIQVKEDGSYVPVLSYELVEGRAVSVNGMVLDHYLSRMASSARKDENGDIQSVMYQEMNPLPWKAEKAWQMTDGTNDFNVYLLLYEDTLVELGAQEALTQEQMSIFGTELFQ